MKAKLATLAAIGVFATLSTGVEAKGCLKGAVIGGVGGHIAGHHAVVGAAAGCAIGHHIAKKNEKEAKRQSDLARREPARDMSGIQHEAPKN